MTIWNSVVFVVHLVQLFNLVEGVHCLLLDIKHWHVFANEVFKLIAQGLLHIQLVLIFCNVTFKSAILLI